MPAALAVACPPRRRFPRLTRGLWPVRLPAPRVQWFSARSPRPHPADGRRPPPATPPPPPPPPQTLRTLYAETAAALEAIPASAAYRRNVEKVTAHRLGLVNATPDVGALEAKIGIGAVEEVIAAARAELRLIPAMAAWAPWEVPDGKPKVEVTLVE
eukprot:TRINITY_DN18846_c0_g1_i1.p1 TRINITY_DN18846_c0_g1~~TRINITY_DN18846_c0_g1_i1.p1  ORF type:complete len:178 (+),score=43.66 TRINITY_DN18846_c0_g1_i1:66-536(+)